MGGLWVLDPGSLCWWWCLTWPTLPGHNRRKSRMNNSNRSIPPIILTSKKAFRCGLFFPPEIEGQLPIAPLFIFNSSFPADECPTEDSERFIGFCHSIWKKILKYVVYTNPSLKKEKAAKGVTLGDDICGVVKNKVKAPFVGKKSRKFPKGLQIGMYTNSCGSDTWLDTKDRHPQRICCSKGKLADCP